MKDEQLPLVMLAIAAVIAFLPAGSSSTTTVDTLDLADEEYRIGLADTVLEFKDEERTVETAKNFTSTLQGIRDETHKDVATNIMGHWWNGKAELVAKQLKDHKLGTTKEVPNE